MGHLAQDLRYAIRQLMKAPLFVFVTTVTMAIGMAANSAFFSTLDAIVLRPLAIPDLSRVVVIRESVDNHDLRAAYADFEDWQRESSAFSDLAAHLDFNLTLIESGNPQRVRVSQATASLFPLLRAEPWLGRNFRPEENQPGSGLQVILSYPFWRTHFGGDPNVLGRTVMLNAYTYEVIGVMPEGFHYSPTTAIWLPLDVTPRWRADRVDRWFMVVGRLRQDVTLRQAQTEMDRVAAGLARRYPATNREVGIHVQRIVDYLNNGQTTIYFGLIIGVTICLILVVCANVANLELSRSLSRRTEIAIRMAMGANRWRILMPLLLESVLLGLIGGALGLLIAWGILHIIVSLLPAEIASFVPGWNSIGINGRVFLYSLLMAVFTGILCGVGPALAVMRLSAVESLKAGASSATPERKSHRLRGLFVTSQISLCLALVVVAEMLAVSLAGLTRAADRLDPRKVLTFQIALPEERYSTEVERTSFYRESLRRLRNLPGAESVSLGTTLPYGNPGMWWDSLTLPGESVHEPLRYIQRYSISPDYLSSLRVPLISGRMLSDSDVAGRVPVAVVNQSFVARFISHQNALGQRIHLGNDVSAPWITIVGITSDVPMSWMDQSAQPSVYLSFAQYPQTWATYVVRARSDPSYLASSVRHAISAVDGALSVESMETYGEYLRDAFIGLRFAAGSLAANAATALLLAALGIFGVMASTVVERTSEIGVRMALGASGGAILRWIFRQSLVLTAVGMLAGAPLAFALSRLVVHFLYFSSTGNLAIFLFTPFLIVALALVAAILPARRAAAVDPVQTLRSQ